MGILQIFLVHHDHVLREKNSKVYGYMILLLAINITKFLDPPNCTKVNESKLSKIRIDQMNEQTNRAHVVH